MSDGQRIFFSTYTDRALDTVIILDSLRPKTSYIVTIGRSSASMQSIGYQNRITFTTLDTTSHDITWEVDTLGDRSINGFLNDIAIVNDTLVYAVGELYQRDSSGQVDLTAYGMAVWNGGKEWRLVRLLARTPDNQLTYVFPTGIHAISGSRVWLAFSSVFHWDGRSPEVTPFWLGWPWNPNPILRDGQGAVRIWASSSSDVFAVGPGGTILHFDGQYWRRIDAGTTLPVNDVWGLPPSAGNNRAEASVIASNRFLDEGSAVFHIPLAHTAISVPNDTLSWSLSGIWSASPYRHYIVGAGLYWKNGPITSTDQKWTKLPFGSVSIYYLNAVRGNNSNDIFAVGAFGEVLHYNGKTWKSYFAQTGLSSGSYYRVAVKGNLIVAAGETSGHGIVLRGRRH